MYSLVFLTTLATTCLAATFTVQVGPGLTFSPAALTISQGDTVNFNFQSSNHAVTHGSGCSPASPTLFDLGSTGQFTFSQAGTFPYYCPVGNHCAGGMTGVITVNAASAPAPPSTPPSTPPAPSTPSPPAAPNTPSPPPAAATPSPPTGTTPSAGSTPATTTRPSTTTAASSASTLLTSSLTILAPIFAYYNY